MAYIKKEKAIKSLMIFVDGRLYDEYKELTKALRVDRDGVNTKIFTDGMNAFIKKYKASAEDIEKEVQAAEKRMEKTITKIRNKHGL